LADANGVFSSESRNWIVGSSGSGKTTLGLILVGLIEPDAGSVHYRTADGGIVEAGLAGKPTVAYQTHAPLLFKGTVMSNLRLSTHASVEEVEALLWQQGLLGLLDSVGVSLDTLVDDNGTNLSRGQQQAVNVGCLVLANPDVVVLDECLAHLDLAHRRRLLEVVDQALGDKVVIIISHDLSLVDRGDKVMWLTEGRLHSLRIPDADANGLLPTRPFELSVRWR